MSGENEVRWDAFISHASEDKESFVEPLVAELEKYGLKTWFAPFTLRVGDSLRESIDHGLAQSTFGIVILSPSFFAKQWPQKELNGLFSREMQGRKVILPVRHGMNQETLVACSPMLADKFAADSSEGIIAVARSLTKVIKPEAFDIEGSYKETAKRAAWLREQLKSKNPDLDYRITYGHQELDPFKTIGKVTESGLVASGTTEGMKIEIFAADQETYNRSPLSFKTEMPLESLKKLEEVHEKGRTVEFGPEDDIKVFGRFFTSIWFVTRPFRRWHSKIDRRSLC